MVKAGQEQPLHLRQAPKSVQQGSATVLRALLDPILKGWWVLAPHETFKLREHYQFGQKSEEADERSAVPNRSIGCISRQLPGARTAEHRLPCGRSKCEGAVEAQRGAGRTGVPMVGVTYLRLFES